MPQFDFLVISKLSTLNLVFVMFVAFTFFFLTALTLWLEFQVRALFKAILLEEGRTIAFKPNDVVAGAANAVIAIAFAADDLLEQFILIAGLASIFIFIAAIVVILFIYVVFPACFGIINDFVASLNKDINQSQSVYSGRNVINLSVMFISVLMANLCGIMPFSFTFSSSVVVPFFFSTLVFFVCLYILISQARLGLFAGFLPAGVELAIAPLIITIELISGLAKFISLGIRLFANMFAGHLLLKVFYSISFLIVSYASLFTLVLQVGATLFIVFVTLLEIMIAGLQAFVMLLLTILYIREAEGFVFAH